MSNDSGRLKTILTIVVILAVAGGAFYYWQQDNKKDLEYLMNPEVDDLYKYEQENGLYSSFKVVEVQEDGTTIVNENSFEIDAKYFTHSELGYDFFPDAIPLTRQDRQGMWDSGMLYEVDR